jgi:hypothetical protein
MRKNKTLVIDFDGTIVVHNFPFIGPIMPFAKAAIAALYEDFNIIISSCRNNPEVRMQGSVDTLHAMEDWLIENDIKFDHIDTGKTGKPIADYYIDDKAIHFGNDWNRLRDQIR